MKFILIIIIFSISMLLAQQNEYQIYNCETESIINIDKLAEETMKYDVIFFGEFHDHKILHELEISFLNKAYSIDTNIAVSLEMFERDVQPILDSYLEGEISDSVFVDKSRAWPNYETDYKPIVKFAKNNKINVIAANVPRKYAAAIHKNGQEAIQFLPKSEQEFIAENLQVIDGLYKEKFFATMQTMSHGSPMMQKKMNGKLDKLYAAQCLKDDTMAESIAKYIKTNPTKKVIHYNGDFHSAYFLGTVEKLKMLDQTLSIAVISPLYAEKEMKFPEEEKNKGTFVILVYP